MPRSEDNITLHNNVLRLDKSMIRGDETLDTNRANSVDVHSIRSVRLKYAEK